MRLRLIAATALATGLLAAPAAAAEVEALKDCYVSAGTEETQREAIMLRGSDFTPNSTIDVSVDGTLVESGPAGTIGEFTATVPAPYRDTGSRPFSVTVAERGNAANVFTLGSRVTPLTVSLRPAQAAPSRRVRYRGSGFTADRPVFAHYVHGGEERKTVRLVRRPRGDCGRFRVRRRQIPVRRPDTGEWTVQIDQRRQYRERPGTNLVRLLIRVQRVFREP